jgi:hypothetical protein
MFFLVLEQQQQSIISDRVGRTDRIFNETVIRAVNESMKYRK